MPATPPHAASGTAPAPALPDEGTVVGVIGLGYVGLPLAVACAAHYETRGFDLDAERVAELRAGQDRTQEVGSRELAAAERLAFTADAAELAGCDAFIVAVPTPIDAAKRPDLRALEAASRQVAEVIAPGAVAIFESTVYPGCTEEVCVPLIEAASGLRCNRDFFVGYSPERINPGDKAHRLADIVKVTAGGTPETLAFVDALYASIVPAGTYRAPDIRTAEAAKAIENTQRDLNIALVNELAMLFERLGLDTDAVLSAAASKWNFLPFRPGLVGGHCIGVDPYYLTHKAEEVGFRPELVLAGRRINDAMPGHVAVRVVACMAAANIDAQGARILVLGIAFKENCPDVRNTKVADLVANLEQHGATVAVFDPLVAPEDAPHGVAMVAAPKPGAYDAVVLAVAHDAFKELGAATIRGFGKPRCIVFDVKHMLPASAVDGRL